MNKIQKKFSSIIIFLSFFSLLLPISKLFSTEADELESMHKEVQSRYDGFSYGLLTTSEADERIYSVNYFIKNGTFKSLLKRTDALDWIKKIGGKRRWVISDIKNKKPRIYFSGSYSTLGDTLDKNLADRYVLYFKNYCEDKNGNPDPNHSKIKSAKLTLYEAPYTYGTVDFSLRDNWKKYKTFKIQLKPDEKFESIFPNYTPNNPKDFNGSVFLIQLEVLEYYPNKENKLTNFCVQDFYMGSDKRPFENILLEIDDLSDLSKLNLLPYKKIEEIPIPKLKPEAEKYFPFALPQSDMLWPVPYHAKKDSLDGFYLINKPEFIALRLYADNFDQLEKTYACMGIDSKDNVAAIKFVTDRNIYYIQLKKIELDIFELIYRDEPIGKIRIKQNETTKNNNIEYGMYLEGSWDENIYSAKKPMKIGQGSWHQMPSLDHCLHLSINLSLPKK